jgi:replicative DNA helicase
MADAHRGGLHLNLPINQEAELGVIGCCIVGGLDTTTDMMGSTPDSEFYTEECKAAYAVLSSLATAGKTIDTISFTMEWKRVHKAPMPLSILESVNKVPSAANLSYYLEQVLDTAKRRRLILSSYEIIRGASDPTKSVDSVMADAEATLGGEAVSSLPVYSSMECFQALIDHLEERHTNRGTLSGVATGFGLFDHITDGLQHGEQSIIAARPSIGKTAIAMNIVENACLRNKVPTLVISLEMSARSLARRLLASWGRVSLKTLRSGSFTKEDFNAFGRFQTVFKTAPYWVVDGIAGADSNRICAIIRRYARKYGVKLVVIDYLQKITSPVKNEKRTYEVGHVSGALKACAVRTGVALLTLAQLNREPEKDKARMPRLADLADSAQLERDGDLIALLHRQRSGPDSHKAALIIAKQRDGETGVVPLEYEGQFCRFINPPAPTT